MNQLIPLINSLQEAFSNMDGAQFIVDLPQIVVVGSQSAGKSSVLESFIGRDILPRGSGIVTRRPLILQLVHASTEYAQFGHLGDARRFVDFDAVRSEIQAETDRTTGPNKAISDVPISLRVHSPSVLDLTLVDLPGLTKVAVGNQPADIEEQIRSMILHYIANDACLILAVTPANTDLATSDALKMAREVDPGGQRTIGVLTKLDLMDEGTDAREVLENRHLPLRHGYIGVVNRSQRDIDSQRDIHNAVAAERKFFLSHPAYRHMADRMGTQWLQKTLNRELSRHIQNQLPSLQSKLTSHLAILEDQVKSVSRFSIANKRDEIKVLMEVTRSYADKLENELYGVSPDVYTSKLTHGARIRKIFFEQFPYEIVKNEFDETEVRNAISTAIKNIHAIRTGLFTPDMAFETVVKHQIEQLELPVKACVDLCSAELTKAIKTCTEPLSSLPKLCDAITSIMAAKIGRLSQLAKQQLSLMVECHKAYINTNHDDFVGIRLDVDKSGTIRKRPVVEIIRRGYLQISSRGLKSRFGGGKKAWFVLTSENLMWFKDEREEDRKYVFPPENLTTREVDDGVMRKHTFCVASKNGNMFKDKRELHFSADSHEELAAWLSAFARAGIYMEKEQPGRRDDNGDDGCGSGEPATADTMPAHNDPHTERQIETVRNHFAKYIRIINSSVLDVTPKTVVCVLLDRVQQFVRSELFGALNAEPSGLLDIPQEERERQRNLTAAINRMQRALAVIVTSSSSSADQPTASSRLPDVVRHAHATSSSITRPALMGGAALQRRPVSERTMPPPNILPVPPKPRVVTTGPPPIIPPRPR